MMQYKDKTTKLYSVNGAAGVTKATALLFANHSLPALDTLKVGESLTIEYIGRPPIVVKRTQ